MKNSSRIASSFLILSLAIFGIALMSFNVRAQVVNPVGGKSSNATSTVITNPTSSPVPVNIVSSTITLSSTQTSTIITNPSSTPAQTTLATLLACEDLLNNICDVELHYAPKFINTANSTTTVKSGPGFLHTLTFEPLADATTTNISVYDSLTGNGTQIASFVLEQPTSTLNPITVQLDVAVTTGLSIVETGASSSITASFR